MTASKDMDNARETYQAAQVPNNFLDIVVTTAVATANLATLSSGVLVGKWISFRAITADIDVCGGTQAALAVGGGIPISTGAISREYLVSLGESELLTHRSVASATLRVFYRS